MRRKHASLTRVLLVGDARARDASAEHEGKDQKGVTAAGTSTMPCSDRYLANAGQLK